MTLFLTKNLYFRTKHSFMTPFLVSSYFTTHPITVLLQILGGRMHGPSPTSHLCESVPQSPPKSPPMLLGQLSENLPSSLMAEWPIYKWSWNVTGLLYYACVHILFNVYSLQFIYSKSRKSLVQLCSIRISIGLVNTI